MSRRRILEPAANFAPHFPVQQWERDLEVHMRRWVAQLKAEAAARGETWSYLESDALRKAAADLTDKWGIEFDDWEIWRLIFWGLYTKIVEPQAVPDPNKKANELIGLYAGGDKWTFIVERSSDELLRSVVPFMQAWQNEYPAGSSVWVARGREPARVEAELVRRVNRAAYVARRNEAGRDRDAMTQANLADAMAQRNGGRDVLSLVAPMVSGFVTRVYDPSRPLETGPLRSNTQFLAARVRAFLAVPVRRRKRDEEDEEANKEQKRSD